MDGDLPDFQPRADAGGESSREVASVEEINTNKRWRRRREEGSRGNGD